MPAPVFAVPPGSAVSALIASAEWATIPLRIPTRWTVQHNGFYARRLESGQVETNDSEDLLWLSRLAPAWLDEDERAAWRVVSVDVGWYRDTYAAVVLDPDWDHVAAELRTTDLGLLVATIEGWMERPPVEW